MEEILVKIVIVISVIAYIVLITACIMAGLTACKTYLQYILITFLSFIGIIIGIILITFTLKYFKS